MSNPHGPKHAQHKEYWNGYLQLLGTFSPVFLALAILILWPGSGSPKIIGLSAFIAGLSGIVIMLRRRLPMVVYEITGTTAVLQGLFFTLLCWILAALLLV